ncbi:MAG: nicotinate-nucleotide adenylyltransferase [Gammaproteobacteria bacterium]|nr:nicotinate-nucleotide adenylyltransferase [Gammaproteobacteria bacterium]
MIGVFGGTFDPIHFGHLRSALEICESLDLKEIRFVPCRIPPHRDEPLADPMQRLAMVRAALAGQPDMVLDDRELKRDGPSYMIDTLESLRSELTTEPLCLILGMDAFMGLSSWHRWQELLTLAHLVVMHRPGKSLHDVNSQQAAEVTTLLKSRQVKDVKALQTKAAGSIFLHPISQLDISASKIREMVAKGKNPRYLLPDVVLQMIKVQKIYKTG